MGGKDSQKTILRIIWDYFKDYLKAKLLIYIALDVSLEIELTLFLTKIIHALYDPTRGVIQGGLIKTCTCG